MSDKSGTPDDGQKQDDDKKVSPKKRPFWPILLALVVVAAFVAIVLVIALTPNPDVWTDDAYVQVHYASVSPRIAGQVVAIASDDNDHVQARQLLVQLDDRDQRVSLATSQATLDRDRAQFQDALANVGRQPSVIEQQSSQEASLEAQLGLARANRTRYRNLASTGAGTQQSRQSSEADTAQLEAQLAGARASTDAARHQLDVLKAMADADRAQIKADEAQLQQAQLTLSYTRILAPLDATVTNRSVQLGDYVGPGGVLMSLVPLDRLYIVANYRELALRHVLPGQHVRIHVDAYNIDLDGVVQGIPPASGAIYSPVPSNNATGNFTKIVQRLPVKILVAPGQDLAHLLRAGLSVETTIHTGLADVAGEQAHTSGRVIAN
ncbi:HlyD family secretion protein (plasmid) [Lichenicola cladoniae]|uniref:HlyD family secretion protein n=2 Tax=Lichenicola cladoniae TaxID=1484109 RepID=A0A6M8HYI6_9PROT|nr:HlyD family secretion protein [Acetobacteraceae bacterium]QKE93257.1 HlyD family secretion protein [Lichenicola cladoniae]